MSVLETFLKTSKHFKNKRYFLKEIQTEENNTAHVYTFMKTDKRFYKQTGKDYIIIDKEAIIQMNKQKLRENYSELGKKVFDRLQAICDDYEFLKCSMVFLKTEEKAKKMLDFLDYTETTDTDDVIPYLLKIKRGLV